MPGVGGIVEIGSWRNVLIVVWRGAPTQPALAAIGAAGGALARGFARGIGLVGVTPAERPLEALEREPAARLLREQGTPLVGVASVMEGTGFAAGAARSVLSAIEAVACHDCPRGVFATVDEAVAWLAPLLGPSRAPPASRGLRRAVEELRRPGPR